MIRRIIAAVAALLIASVGAVVLWGYVARADQRAMAGMETVTVLVVDSPVAKGTPAEDLTELVSRTELPAKAAARGSLSSLEPLDGLVATTELLPGEQLLKSRFATPESLAAAGEFVLPEEAEHMHQVTIPLAAPRALGGHLVAGNTVGVFVSVVPEDEESGGNRTHLTLHKVLVTKVEGGISRPSEGEAGEEPSQAPSEPAETVLVTLAVTAPDAEKIVFAAEHGTIWLSSEPQSAPEDGTKVRVVQPPHDTKDVYQ